MALELRARNPRTREGPLAEEYAPVPAEPNLIPPEQFGAAVAQLVNVREHPEAGVRGSPFWPFFGWP